MRTLLDPVLQRAGENLGPLRPAAQIATGLVVSTEVGVVVGYLAQRVLGQYELVLLDEAVQERPPRLLFVLPNLGQAVRTFGADEKEFMTWVALHEVTHAVQFAGVPWLHAHMAGLVRELLATAELRIEAPHKLRLPTGAEIRRVAGALRRGDLISVVTSEPERETLDRVQAVMAVIEGHAEHVMDAVAPDLLPVAPQAPGRARPPPAVADRAVATGGQATRAGHEAAPVRAGQVLLRRDRQPSRARGVAAGVRGPESLPTFQELTDPSAWIARVMPHEVGQAQRHTA